VMHSKALFGQGFEPTTVYAALDVPAEAMGPDDGAADDGGAAEPVAADGPADAAGDPDAVAADDAAEGAEDAPAAGAPLGGMLVV